MSSILSQQRYPLDEEDRSHVIGSQGQPSGLAACDASATK